MTTGERPAIPLPAPAPLFVVLTGPSGAGKDAVLDELRVRGTSRHFVITATTRPARTSEAHGTHYHFFTAEKFLELREAGQFLETAEVYGNHYGVPRWEVAEPLAAGHDVLLRTDVQGAASLKHLIPDAIVIFVSPASLDELAARLIRRNSETDESLARRLAAAGAECALIPNFDYVVVNREGALAQTVSAVEAIMTAERARTHPRQVALP